MNTIFFFLEIEEIIYIYKYKYGKKKVGREGRSKTKLFRVKKIYIDKEFCF